MLAILIGDLSFLLGLSVLLLPLLLTELSRPRDGFLGAALMFLGLILVTSNDRLRGSPVLAVLCGAFLISRLGWEVALSRWQQLTQEEKLCISSRERWTRGIQELIAALANLGGLFRDQIEAGRPTSKPSKRTKKWVRPDKSQDTQAIAESLKSSSDDSQESKEFSQESVEVRSSEGQPSSKDS